MNVLFTICGRAGSKGVKNKNIKRMDGIPLINYTLAVIKLYEEKHPEVKVSVVLNTDSEALVEQALLQTGVKDIQILKRQENLAGDTIAKVDVIKDCYIQCKEESNYNVVVDLDLTSPLRRLCDVEIAIGQLISRQNADLVFSAVPGRRNPYFNMVEKSGDYYKKICKSHFTARQQAPAIYELNASIYAYNPKFLESTFDKTILDYNCGIVEMPDYLVLDIDSEEDFELMSYLMNYFENRDQELKQVIETARKIHL